MWLLISEHAIDNNIRGKMYPLFLDKDQYDVGRDTTCEILQTDAVVSRKHAILYPVTDMVKLEDEKSRFGTYVNASKTKILNDEHTFLKQDDVISFGRHENAWRLRKLEITVITTNLDPREKIELKSLLRILNGNQVISPWSNSVTHVVSPTVHFKPKFLLGLVNCVPIVNLQYFRDAGAIIRATGALPEVKEYVPKPAPDFPEVCDFSVNEQRKCLFKGLAFIFLDQRKMTEYQTILKSAGATVQMWDKKKSSIIRVASRVIGESKGSAEHQETNEYLLGKGRRLIPHTEIGMAIATISMERYCNPKYNPEVGHILALETPCVRGSTSSDDVICMEEIPETIVLDDDSAAVSDPEKTSWRICNKTVTSNTEIPETVASAAASRQQNEIEFGDDDDEAFNERSQQILDLVEKHSSPAVMRKRKHSGSDSEDSQQTKKTYSQLGRFDSSQFIARPSQKLVTQSVAPESAPRPAPVTTKPKRTLDDLLAKSDEDSEEEMVSHRKKAKTVTPVVKKRIPSLLKAVDSVEKKPVVEVVDGPVKEVPKIIPIRVSQLTDGWLSKTLRSECTISAESLDETRAWIAPLLNSVQVKELKVDLSNYSSKKTQSMRNSTASSVDATANLSGRKNFKSFKKQSFHKCSMDNTELTKTTSVLITGKL